MTTLGCPSHVPQVSSQPAGFGTATFGASCPRSGRFSRCSAVVPHLSHSAEGWPYPGSTFEQPDKTLEIITHRTHMLARKDLRERLDRMTLTAERAEVFAARAATVASAGVIRSDHRVPSRPGVRTLDDNASDRTFAVMCAVAAAVPKPPIPRPRDSNPIAIVPFSSAAGQDGFNGVPVESHLRGEAPRQSEGVVEREPVCPFVSVGTT